MSEKRDEPGRRRELRRDAVDNRNRVLAAAAVAVRREGTAVPMATIAADAGVGVGTVYRHFPSRDALLGALTHRSFELVLETARRAAALNGPPIEGIRFFLERTIAHGTDLVLPMHGGPVSNDQATVALRDEAHRTLGSILERGKGDGSIRIEVTRADIVTFGALLAQGLPHVPDWKSTARRHADIYLAGLLNRTGRPDQAAEPAMDQDPDRRGRGSTIAPDEQADGLAQRGSPNHVVRASRSEASSGAPSAAQAT